MTKIFDTGFISEADQIRRSGGIPMYEYMRSSKVPLDEMIKAAELASQGKEEKINVLTNYLKNKDSAIRYWGATGLLILEDKAAPAKEELLNVLDDESPNVIVVAAELLYKLGEKGIATNALLKVLEYPDDKAKCHALNAVVYLGEDGLAIKAVIKRLATEKQYTYSLRIVELLIEKWNI